jgi:hypothetical protein
LGPDEKRANTYGLLAVLNGNVDELGVLGLLGSSEDQGRVGGGILWLVLANSYHKSISTNAIFHFLVSRYQSTY